MDPPNAGKIGFAVSGSRSGAERFGLPSGVLGNPSVGRLGHCAISGDSDAERASRLASVLIWHPRRVS